MSSCWRALQLERTSERTRRVNLLPSRLCRPSACPTALRRWRDWWCASLPWPLSLMLCSFHEVHFLAAGGQWPQAGQLPPKLATRQAAHELPHALCLRTHEQVWEGVHCAACSKTTHQNSYTQYFYNTQASGGWWESLRWLAAPAWCHEPPQASGRCCRHVWPSLTPAANVLRTRLGPFCQAMAMREAHAAAVVERRSGRIG